MLLGADVSCCELLGAVASCWELLRAVASCCEVSGCCCKLLGCDAIKYLCLEVQEFVDIHSRIWNALLVKKTDYYCKEESNKTCIQIC